MTLTPEAHVIHEAREVVPRCRKESCDLPAEWIVWEHGQHYDTHLHMCERHCPPCTSERGGFCKEGHKLSGLAAALMRLEPVQAPRAASGDTEGSHPAKPLTGAELAAKHGFEPIPDWRRDPVARPMQSAASGDASKEET